MSRLRRLTRLAAALTVGWLALACDAPPADPDAPAAHDVLEADATRRAAQVAADPEALGQILHDRLVYRHSDGRDETKSELIASLTGGAIDYRKIRVDEIAAVTCAGGSDYCLRALQTLEVTFEGGEFTVPSCYLARYVRERGQLQLVAYRSASLVDDGVCPL